MSSASNSPHPALHARRAARGALIALLVVALWGCATAEPSTPGADDDAASDALSDASDDARADTLDATRDAVSDADADGPDAVSCPPQACAPGAYVCVDEGARALCQADAEGCGAPSGAPLACGDAQRCQLGVCVDDDAGCPADACTPGAPVCVGDGVATCIEDAAGCGQPSSAPAACGAGQRCEAGACVEAPSTCAEHPDVGQPCEVGLGVCQASGAWRCPPGEPTPVCDASPGTGAAEVCGDGLDNDCDGDVDDADADLASLGQSCAGAGSCGGLWVCDGGDVACQVIATDDHELCDGLDNDCDGGVDTAVIGGATRNACTACLDDDLEDNDGSNDATPIGAGASLDAVLCGSLASGDLDWFGLGAYSVGAPLTLELTHPTTSNGAGQAYAALRAEVFCGGAWCGFFDANTGAQSAGAIAAACTCGAGSSLHLRIYPRTTSTNPSSGTPYTLRRL